MSIDLSDRVETSDGSRPDAALIENDLAKTLPLSAFSVLTSGDAFESRNQKPPPDGEARARNFIDKQIELVPHNASVEHQERVVFDIARQLSGNLQLIARLHKAKPLRIDLVPPGTDLSKLGFPKSAYRQVAGLFWNHPKWDKAKIALRQEYLDSEPTLVVHEMAHAVHYLAFTQNERDMIYRLLGRSFGQRWEMDEVFAIYTEREFIDAFTDANKRGPHVYGHVRRQWSEDHVFTRFVRKLYFPHKPLAGPKVGYRF